MIKLKKLLFVLITFLFVFLMASNVFATNIVLDTDNLETSNTVKGKTTLELVENNVCTIDVDDYGRFTKQITEFNEYEKSAILTLTFTNLKNVEETYRDVEIFFVIDNSSSMSEQYNGLTRKQAVIDSANSLTDRLFNSNPNVEIGVVGFSSLDFIAGETEGTINDATLKLKPSSSKDAVKGAISDLANLKAGPRTNIEAGLSVAQNNFSDDTNKKRYIILLTDGVPNNATDGTFATYSGVVASRTKSKIEEIQNSGIEIIAAMINLNSERVEPTTQRTYRALAEEIFGTEENPTTSKYFYISDADIQDTIVNDIFSNLVVVTDNTLRNIVIKDYFPQEIIDNFDFEYVASPNIGTVSEKVDTTDNSITWNIELLSEGETATLSYKLKLKEDYNKEIIDKILPTNEKVDITAENNDKDFSETSDVSPTVRVEYEEPVIDEPNIVVNEITPPDNEVVINKVDNTVANTILPQTGENSVELFVAIFSIIAIIVICRIIYLRKYSDD